MTTTIRLAVLLGFLGAIPAAGCIDRRGLDPFGGARTPDAEASGGDDGGATGGTAGGGSGGSGTATGGSGGIGGKGGTGGTGGTGGKGGTGGTGGTSGKGGAGGPAPDGGSDAAFECGPVCLVYCNFGNVVDEHGCPTCACKPPPDAGSDAVQCGPVCKIFCQFGNVADEHGCPTCACNPPPPCAPGECKGPRPGAPNFTCSDGKTVGGPACQRADDGTCQWQIVSCPGQCVQTVLCIRGDHFDNTVCRCVPNADAAATPACDCPDGDVCVEQIGGPAIPADPPRFCQTPRHNCDGPSPCGCLRPKDGHCRPDPMVQGLCLCDNGIP